MHTTCSLINVDFTERQLWSRILSEAEEISARDIFLAPIMAGCISQSVDLPGAIMSRVASLLSPPLPATALHAALRAMLDQDPRILSAASFDLAAIPGNIEIGANARTFEPSRTMNQVFEEGQPLYDVGR